MGDIAIIGTGISGLGAAFLLNPHHTITVYEKSGEIGGHTRTCTVNYDGKEISVDTGFIVFNYRNYPHLSKLFKHLDVPVQKSVMSFGVSADHGALEWAAENVNSLFGQRRNLVNPQFYRFLLDIVRFNRGALAMSKKIPDATLGELIQKMGLGPWFAPYYILPMGGAIWSCPLSAILDFPAKTFIDFFEAHGLLTVTNQPQWYTVTGGSKEYVKRLIKPFADKIRRNCAATRITRQNGRVIVEDSRGDSRVYDHVILACHGDEALAMLADANTEERLALSAFHYQSNLAVLHSDTSIMPKRRRCWASWIYHADSSQNSNALSVTYWMNQLQNIPDDTPLFVTLNPIQPIAKDKIFDQHIFKHPIYRKETLVAQQEVQALQGSHNTWFCGAHLRNGFHEDGLASAVNVAKQLGAKIPWQ